MIKKTLIGILSLAGILFVLGTVAASEKRMNGQETVVLQLPFTSFPDQYGLRHSEKSIEKIAEPYLKKLDRLQSEGIVVDYELVVKEPGISVTVNDVDSLQILEGLGFGVEYLPSTTSREYCGENSIRSMQAYQAEAFALDLTTHDGQTTDPYLGVMLRGESAYVHGRTSPGVEVAMSVKDSSGLLKTQGTTLSDEDGYFFFGSDYFGCKDFGWLLGAGDVVEVTASGNTINTVVVPLSAYPDLATGELAGITAPNRSIESGYAPTLITCETEFITATLTSDDNGFFSTTLSEGFDRSGGAYVIVFDENGNYTYANLYPAHIGMDYDGEIFGAFKPRVSFLGLIRRDGKIIETISGITDRTGRYFETFSEPLQAGDGIEVHSGGEIVYTTYAAVTDLIVDVDMQTISGDVGIEGAGRRVVINPCRADEVECDGPCGCLTGDVDGIGDFVLDFSANEYNLHRGDFDGTPILFDDQGNSQYMRGNLYAPYVEVELNDDSVNGYWIEPGILVTATLRDSNGAVKGIDTDTSSDYSARFNHYFFSEKIEAGERIDVSDGTFTMTVTSVPTLTTYLDTELDTVSGEAPGTGSLVVDIWKNLYNSEHFSSWTHYCDSDAYSDGNYSIDLSSKVDTKAHDRAYVYYQEQDGHLIESFGNAFSIAVEIYGDDVNGFTSSPQKEVIIELWRGGNLLSTDTTTSYDDGRYYTSLSDTEPISITHGDIIKVIPEDMGAYDLIIPELTLNEDPANNTIFGAVPASSKLHVYIERLADWNFWWSEIKADNGGNYLVDFTGNYEDCQEARVGGCSQSQLAYYDDAGHIVNLSGPAPNPESEDMYEPDDGFSTANTYDNVQSHTFHDFVDVDWIQFDVSEDDVGKTYILATKNLGVNANTNLHLYDVDGVTEIMSDTNSIPPSSMIVWQASAQGSYYLKIIPNSLSDTEDCGSTYDFEILHGLVYLPLLMK